jgi:sec-independent protein translocase protein TatA
VIGDIIQPTHLIFILVVALLVLGPKRLPEVGRSLGRGIRDFREAMTNSTAEARELIYGEQSPSTTGSVDRAPTTTVSASPLTSSFSTSAEPDVTLAEPEVASAGSQIASAERVASTEPDRATGAMPRSSASALTATSTPPALEFQRAESPASSAEAGGEVSVPEPVYSD